MSMNRALQTAAMPTPQTTPASTPVHTGFLQRKCACGGSTASTGECEDCDKNSLSLQRSIQEPGHDFRRINVTATPPIRTKLAISQPGDTLELEADRVAEQVMRMPQNVAQPERATLGAPPSISRLSTQHSVSSISRQTNDEQPKDSDEELLDPSSLLSMKSLGPPTGSPSPELVGQIQSMRGGGQPLAPRLRNFFEPRFGHDFSKVRVHTDARAAQTTQELKARAYTVGHDIAIAPHEYKPDTQAGRLLLAHELTHVVQQSDQVHTLMRACDCPAMGATTPSGGLDTFLRSQFPRLVTTDYCVTGPATGTYNCIAWSIGNTSSWIWNDVDNYGNQNGTVEISDFDAFYDRGGLKPVTDSTPTDAQVALYAVGTTPKHAARKTGAACGAWESKLGTNVRIAHLPNQLEGGTVYGDINRYYVPK